MRSEQLKPWRDKVLSDERSTANDVPPQHPQLAASGGLICHITPNTEAFEIVKCSWEVLGQQLKPQNHRMVEFGGYMEVTWSNPSAQAGPHRDNYPRPCLDGFWLSPRMETPWLPCATCAHAGSPSQQHWVAHSEEENICPVVKGWLLLPKGYSDPLEPQQL